MTIFRHPYRGRSNKTKRPSSLQYDVVIFVANQIHASEVGHDADALDYAHDQLTLSVTGSTR